MRYVILHGTSSNHTSNWFPWLKETLEQKGHEVWVPDLPGADRPNTQAYNKFLTESGYNFNDCIIIGHSSGAVEILSLLPVLPDGEKVKAAILIGAFTERLAESPSWEMLRELFDKPLDFEAIKKRAQQFIFIHSQDDPFCPIEQAEYLCEGLGGDFVKLDGMGHFSYQLDSRFKKFPELIGILEDRKLV